MARSAAISWIVLRPLIASMATRGLNSRLWVRRLLIGGSPDQGRCPVSEVNDGPSPEKPVHLRVNRAIGPRDLQLWKGAAGLAQEPHAFMAPCLPNEARPIPAQGLSQLCPSVRVGRCPHCHRIGKFISKPTKSMRFFKTEGPQKMSTAKQDSPAQKIDQAPFSPIRVFI